MNLLRYGAVGSQRPGILDNDGQIRDLSVHVPDINGIILLPAEMARLAALELERRPHVAGTPRLGPCVSTVGQFICIGLNYSDHAAHVTAPHESRTQDTECVL